MKRIAILAATVLSMAVGLPAHGAPEAILAAGTMEILFDGGSLYSGDWNIALSNASKVVCTDEPEPVGRRCVPADLTDGSGITRTTYRGLYFSFRGTDQFGAHIVMSAEVFCWFEKPGGRIEFLAYNQSDYNYFIYGYVSEHSAGFPDGRRLITVPECGNRTILTPIDEGSGDVSMWQRI